MNKLKNIGITALAGTLVSLSAAQAGGVSVTGSWELTYTKLDHAKVTGNPIGVNKNVSFGASGDLSDGGAVTWATTIGASDGFGLSSASMNINMGGIATLAYDSGTGGYGANAVDNIVPTAWEEVDHGLATGISDLGAVSSSKGVINFTVKAPVAGTGFSLSYAPRVGGAHISDGATGGDTGNGQGIDLVLDIVDYDAAHFGFRWGVAGQIEIPEMTCARQRDDLEAKDLSSCSGVKDNPYGGSMFTKLQLGPIHLGTQATFKNPQLSGVNDILNTRSIVAGGALVFGDTLSVSYGRGWDKYRYNNRNRGFSGVSARGEGDPTTGPEEHEYHTNKIRGWSAALNLGPVALKAQQSRADSGESTGQYAHEVRHSEINLSIAF